MGISRVLLFLSLIVLPTLCIYTFSVTFSKVNRKRVLWGICGYILLSTAVAYCRDFVISDAPLYLSFVSLLIDFAFVMYVCDSPVLKRITFALKAIGINVSILFVLSFLYILLVDNVYLVNSEDSWFHVSAVVAYLLELQLFFTIIIIKKMRRNNFSYGYIALSVAITLSTAFIMFLSPMVLKPSYYVPQYIFIAISLSLTLLVLSIFALLRGLISIWEQNYRLKVVLEKTTMEEEYYKSIQESLKQISIIRHDYKNHLGIIELLMEKEDYAKAKEYIKKINTETIHATEELINSPSPVVSSIVTSKSAVLAENGGVLNFSASFPGIFFDDFDIVSILSNVLDNAIRAASGADRKEVRLSFNQLGDNLMIECVNYYSGKLIKENGRFLTTKSTDKMLHGLGLESVRQTVEKLHGFVKIQDDHETFNINICIPNIVPRQM